MLSHALFRSTGLLGIVARAGCRMPLDEYCTVTSNACGALTLPLASSAVQLTWVVPIGNRDPDAGRQATVGFASTASVAAGPA